MKPKLYLAAFILLLLGACVLTASAQEAKSPLIDSWKPIFENQPALGIGDIALASSDPDIIWLGSGESLKKARNKTRLGADLHTGDPWFDHLYNRRLEMSCV